jgi:hypothetical protein
LLKECLGLLNIVVIELATETHRDDAWQGSNDLKHDWPFKRLNDLEGVEAPAATNLI